MRREAVDPVDLACHSLYCSRLRFVSTMPTPKTKPLSPAAPPPRQRSIRLRGVRTHNLQGIDLDLPLRRWFTFCGVSGSGKTSLAIDTLHAEGQRRYIESLSLDSRQFVTQLPRPAADSIEGLVPSAAIRARSGRPSPRAWIGSATEIADYLQLLFGLVAVPHCPRCGVELRGADPASIAGWLTDLPPQTRLQLGFPEEPLADEGSTAFRERLVTQGFVRAIQGEQTVNFSEASEPLQPAPLTVVFDRLTADPGQTTRLLESLGTALELGNGRCVVFGEVLSGQAASQVPISPGLSVVQIDGRAWNRWDFQRELGCPDCGIQLPPRQPKLFDCDSAQGACPTCEGFGDVQEFDLELIVPDQSKSLREGAIAPWNTPAYAHELNELLALADAYELPVDIPFAQLQPQHLDLIWRGVRAKKFGGLDGFFAWLQKRIYRMHHRIFLNRWRSYRRCPACQGKRLKPAALAFTVGDRNFADVCELECRQLLDTVAGWSFPPWQQSQAAPLQQAVVRRLEYLCRSGLSYLQLARPLRTLSDGEQQRVALTAILASNLVNMLYVLDEPSGGLHPANIVPLVESIGALRDRGNTVVAVDHEPELIAAADEVLEIGPRAGHEGGRIVFQGTPRELLRARDSLTGNYLAGRTGVAYPESRRSPRGGALRLRGARGNNLQDVDVDFPTGVLCLVAGMSGAGKSTLVRRTLFPAVAQALQIAAPAPLPFDEIHGADLIDEVVLMERKAIGRTSRSNPVTYVKAFDEIRQVFAATPDARNHGITASHFSFNVDGGRCEKCKGEGSLRIDLQFMEDLIVECDHCHGTRYRRDILQVRYRDKSIADVLNLTVRQAFAFFRGQRKLQSRLKPLFDVGLDYLPLGQSLSTLSTGESQRLKLASYVSQGRRGRCLFVLEEPTTGLHMDDIVKLVDCFDALLAVGHSLVVVEHNLQLMSFADWIIELGPGAAHEGGRVICQGAPEVLLADPASVTGPFLRRFLDRANGDNV